MLRRLFYPEKPAMSYTLAPYLPIVITLAMFASSFLLWLFFRSRGWALPQLLAHSTAVVSSIATFYFLARSAMALY